MKKKVTYQIRFRNKFLDWKVHTWRSNKREALVRLRQAKHQFPKDKWRCVRVTEEVIEE